jgi:hypothetical protein
MPMLQQPLWCMRLRSLGYVPAHAPPPLLRCSQIGHASAGGGTHVYLSGAGIGSAFSPPTVFVGINADAECVVQPFTSSRNRLHCIIGAEGLPPPDLAYNPAGRFYDHPLRVYKSGKLAQCWHVGGINHACFVRYDLGGTPRVERLLTPTLQSSGLVRIRGQGIDGGLLGAPGMITTLFRGVGQLVVGACGEKDCAPSNMGMETIGCMSRVDGSGDAVLSQETTPALAWSDSTSFGCKLDALAGGLTGGFFNLSMHAMDELHRGDAYMGFMTNERVDYATGTPFVAELLPRITGVTPAVGSQAGGTDVTIYGTGFGSETEDLRITVGHGARCHVTAITPDAVHCQVETLTAPADGVPPPPPKSPDAQSVLQQDLTSYPSQRGVRFQWLDDGSGSELSHGGGGDVLLGEFSAPLDYEAGRAGSKVYVEGWFEPPVSCGVSFFLRLDGGSATLQWSGDDSVNPVETLAYTDPSSWASVLVWPTDVSAWNSTAVSRRVDLVAGQRYWLALTCTSPANADTSTPESGRCAVGARLHTTSAPRKTRLFEPTGRTHRRLGARTKLKGGCGSVDRPLQRAVRACRHALHQRTGVHELRLGRPISSG